MGEIHHILNCIILWASLAQHRLPSLCFALRASVLNCNQRRDRKKKTSKTLYS